MNVAKIKVFCSYDYDHDHHLKGSLLGQSKRQDSPFSINDFSLKEAQPDAQWVSKAQSAIARCDVFIVLLGQNTHFAPDILKEVRIAKGLNKARFQLRPKGRKYYKLKDAGVVVTWKWKNLQGRLNPKAKRN